MSTKVIIITFSILITLMYPAALYSQDAPKGNKQANNELVKQRKAKGKEAKKADKKAIKAHYKAQGRKTKRRMKKNQRRSNRKKKNRRPPFWKSWFSNNDLEMYNIEFLI